MSKNQSCLLVINTKCVWRNVFYGVLCVWNRTAVFVPSYDITRRWRFWPWWVNEGARHAVSCSTVNWAWREGAAVMMSSWKPRVGRLSSGRTLWLVIRGNRCKIIRVFCGVWCEVKLWGRYLCRPTLHRQEQVMWFVNWKELIGILTIDSIFSCN